MEKQGNCRHGLSSVTPKVMNVTQVTALISIQVIEILVKKRHSKK